MIALEDMRPSGWDTVAHILEETKLFDQTFDWPSVIQVYSLLFGIEVLADQRTRDLFLPASHVLLFDEYYELTTIDNSRYVAFVQPTLLVTAKGKWVQPYASHLVTQQGKKYDMCDIGTLLSLFVALQVTENTRHSTWSYRTTTANSPKQWVTEATRNGRGEVALVGESDTG